MPVDRMHCLSKADIPITLRGNFLAEVFEYIEIKLALCPEYSEYSGTECASPEEIEDFFKKRFVVNIAFANNLVNI